jgi:tetratricopeptide (TPR) repeat protein
MELSAGHLTAALGDFNTLLQVSKTSDSAYYYRGAAYNRLQKFELAFDDLNVYVGRHPDDGDGYVERGIARAGLGQSAAATADFTAALIRYRRNADDGAVARTNALLAALHNGASLPLPGLQ